MGKLKLFTIILDNPTGVYLPCDYLQGHVKVELTDKMKMRGIRLHIYGGAEVKWEEEKESDTDSEGFGDTKCYTANETYLHENMVLFGKASGQKGDNPTLPAGSYTYPFRYQLPYTLPPSFDGSIGRISYWIRGTIDKPWRFDDTTIKVFTVAGQLDLNQLPEAMREFRSEDEMNLCCLCCKSGPISCSFELDQSGYVPGESIPIKAEIINHSNRQILGSCAKLYSMVTYYATTKSKKEINKIRQISHGCIRPGKSDTWNGDPLPIPPLPPSELRGCRIIKNEYYVQFSVLPSGITSQLGIRADIIIGSIPLVSSTGVPAAPPRFGPSQWQLHQEMAQAFAPPTTSEPTPMYAESTFGKVNINDVDDIEYTKGHTDHVPAHAYYNEGSRAEPSAPPQYFDASTWPVTTVKPLSTPQ